MRRWLIFVPPVVALFFFACSSEDETDETTATPPCCTSDDPYCGIQQDEAGVCLACCRGDTCGFPPETDGACPGVTFPDAGSGCTTNAQCGAGFACAYPLTDICTAQSVCIALDAGPPCDPGDVFCGCNGQPVACVVQGYTAAPVQYFGECDGGSD